MISQSDKKHFKAIAHHLKPIVTIAGNGLSEGVITELGRALNDHELIKIRVSGADREERREIIDAACTASGAELVQSIGNIAVLYKAADKPNPALSNVLRANVLKT